MLLTAVPSIAFEVVRESFDVRHLDPAVRVVDRYSGPIRVRAVNIITREIRERTRTLFCPRVELIDTNTLAPIGVDSRY